MRDRKTVRYRFVFPALILSVAGCGAEGESDTAARAEAPTQNVAAEAECRLPDGLLQRFGLQRQVVLSLVQAEGRNLASVEAIGAPEPATFRSLAQVLNDLDLSTVGPNAAFEAPEDVVRNLRQTADLLEAALATNPEGADPAWTTLAEFYTQEFFARQNASIGYYLTEAGCS